MPEALKRLLFQLDIIRVACFACILVMCLATGCSTKRANFMFGVIADVQYANKDSSGSREYRESINTLSDTVLHLNSKDLIDNASYVGAYRKPSFVIQLGDIIDGGPNAEVDLDTVLDTFNKIRAPKYHVIGNHDCSGIDRKTAMEKLGIKRAYYDFSKGKWRFVVLDTTDISLTGWSKDSENYLSGQKLLNELVKKNAPNAKSWGGAIGYDQKHWLGEILKDAEMKKQKVAIFGHHPLMPDGDDHVLWNSEEVIEIMESYSCVVAYLNGHRHSDSYAWKNGICYVTIEGMVEATQKKVYSVVWVYDDRLSIESTGKVPRLSIPFD